MPDREPHKWAEVIHAWADGKEVQLRTLGCPVWITAASLDHIDHIGHPRVEWRIKPDPVKVRYRVALFKYEHSVPIPVACNDAYVVPLWESNPNFVRWIGDWREEEV